MVSQNVTFLKFFSIKKYWGTKRLRIELCLVMENLISYIMVINSVWLSAIVFGVLIFWRNQYYFRYLFIIIFINLNNIWQVHPCFWLHRVDYCIIPSFNFVVENVA